MDFLIVTRISLLWKVQEREFRWWVFACVSKVFNKKKTAAIDVAVSYDQVRELTGLQIQRLIRFQLELEHLSVDLVHAL